MSDDLHRLGLKLKFAYSMGGLVLGLACIIAGVVLGLGGVAGHTSWVASFLGLSSNITDAGPGVIVFIVGVFLVLITRFAVREQREVVETADGGGGGEPDSPFEKASRTIKSTITYAPPGQ